MGGLRPSCRMLDRRLPFDPYLANRETGGFVLIDRLTNRLGEDRVWRARPVESHVPELAVGRARPLAPRVYPDDTARMPLADAMVPPTPLAPSRIEATTTPARTSAMPPDAEAHIGTRVFIPSSATCLSLVACRISTLFAWS